jgi:hypothetical protein
LIIQTCFARGQKAFDGLEGSGINANNIVAFERVAVAA